KVLRFLADDKKGFLAGLEKKNPVTVGRFGVKMDPNLWYFADGRNWTQEEREDRLNDPDRKGEQSEPRPLQREFWESWLKPAAALTPPDDWSDADKKRLEKLVESNQKLAATGFFNGTSLTESVLTLLNREVTSKVQGVIVFTDGRSTISTGKDVSEI